MEEDISKTTKGDIAHSAIKAGLGSLPVIGSAASELFGLLITPPLEKRRINWMNDVAEKIKELESKGEINYEELQNNELFLDVVLQATSLALKTSEKEKIQAFKNVILNSALGELTDETKIKIFLNQIDNFTTWHIKILHFIDDPQEWFTNAGIRPKEYMAGSLHSVIIDAFPELSNQDALLDIIWNDLSTAGFHRTGSLKTMMSSSGLYVSRTTDLGKEFLSFISFYE
ncbi:MAG: hypothetical protein ACLTWE_08045 [Dysgonomonas mossii]|uniref:hypothetical protein n=1 Tax=Dysgonomonas mossii TaxID=163665 RepID=UPI003992BDD5